MTEQPRENARDDNDADTDRFDDVAHDQLAEKDDEVGGRVEETRDSD